MPAPRPPLAVRPLELRDVPTTARVLADAMDVDAAYRYLFPEPSVRRRGLSELFGRNLELHLSHRCAYVALGESGEVAGTVTLRPVGGISIRLSTMIRRGLLPFALRHGAGAVKRLLWLKDTYDAFEAEIAGHAPHWYVHMMGVKPALQGTGVGSALLGRVLALTGALTSGHPMVLTTHLPQNVRFYERAGFTTSCERTVEPPDGEPYRVWGMRREGTSPTG